LPEDAKLGKKVVVEYPLSQLYMLSIMMYFTT